MGLVHESITYIFSNKINYLVEDFISLEVLVMASLSCDQNLEKKVIYCPLAFRCHLSLWYCLCQNWQRDWWDRWLAPIWFGSFVASWGVFQWKIELNGVLQLGQFAHTSCFDQDFMLGLAMRVEYFDEPLTWWFSPLRPILLLSYCDLYKMDKATIYCHGFLFHMSFSR